jgi:LPS sulfotransferase NodH
MGLEPLAGHSELERYADWIRHPPLPDHPREPDASYFICGAVRSGSWLLSGLLASTGVAGQPHEWFYGGVETTCRQDWGAERFGTFIARVRDAGTTRNGVFGAKVGWGYMEDFLRRLHRLGGVSEQTPRASSPLRALLGHLRPFPGTQTGAQLIACQFPDPRYIWIRRQDTTAQAVSFAKAWQTGRWHHWNAPHSANPPGYDRELIDTLIDSIAAQDAGWSGWFEANRIRPFEVRYEDLVADAEGIARAVLSFLGIESDGVRIAQLTTKMSDVVNEEWLRAYREGASARDEPAAESSPASAAAPPR